ncbi:hypothetical protein D3C87_1399150 [compost metagenome]
MLQVGVGLIGFLQRAVEVCAVPGVIILLGQILVEALDRLVLAPATCRQLFTRRPAPQGIGQADSTSTNRTGIALDQVVDLHWR